MNDILALSIPALRAATGYRVATERPTNPPAEMLTIRRAGGGGDRFVDEPRITVFAWAASDARASEMAQQAVDAMLALPDTAANVSAVALDALYSDDIDGNHRWAATFDCVVNR